MGKKILKSSHEGELQLGDHTLNSYVLENGERVLSRIEFIRAIGRKGKPKGGRKYDQESKVPVFLTANNLKPFITSELIENSNPIYFRDKNGTESIGYRAALLPEVCYVFIDAKEKDNALKANQNHIYTRCKELVRAFAKVGIIALVDEATGYQYDREKDELQKILKAYISDELLPWQKRFPDDFYKEIFRLNGWDFTVNGIKKRPGVVGRWTNTLIYEQLPIGVLEELRSKTPKNTRLHQSLTLDVGEPNLTAQINQVLTIFRLSDTMEEMWSNFKRMNDRKKGQLEIPFKFDEKGSTIPIDPPLKEKPLSAFDNKLKKALDFNPKGY